MLSQVVILTNYFTNLYFVSFWISKKSNLGRSWFQISSIGNLEIIMFRILHYAKKWLLVYYSPTYETKHLLYSWIRMFIDFIYKFLDFVNQIVNIIYCQTLDYASLYSEPPALISLGIPNQCTYINTYKSKTYRPIFKCKHVLKTRKYLVIFEIHKYHVNLITKKSQLINYQI